MKKALSFILTLIIACSLFCFSSCKTGSSFTGWFKTSTLIATGLTSMPKPDFEYKDSDIIRRYVKGVIEKEEFERYVNEVFDWLTDRYEYIGTGGYEISTFFGGAGTYKFVECEKKLEEFGGFTEGGSGYYDFVFFKESPGKDNYFTTDIIRLYYSPKLRAAGEGEDVYYYNFTVELKNGGMKDKYVYTNQEYFDHHFSYDFESVNEATEYPKIEVIRDYQAYCEYLANDDKVKPWQEYAFQGKILVVLTFNRESSDLHFNLKSITKRDEKFVFEIQKYSYEDRHAKVGEYKYGILLDDYVKIFTAEDVVLKIIDEVKNEKN